MTLLDFLNTLTFGQQVWVGVMIVVLVEILSWLIFYPITSRLDKIIKLLTEAKKNGV